MSEQPEQQWDEQGWDQRILAWQDTPHYVQGSAWAAVKAGGPWSVEQREVAGRAVQVFSREAAGFGVLQHAPRVSGIRAEDVPALTEAFREQREDAFSLKLEGYQPRDPELEAAFAAAGWVPAKASQYRFGVTVRIGDGEEQVFADMKKRARNEIRQAEKHGVVVERVEPTEANQRILLDLIRVTEDRSGAFFRDDTYLTTVWNAFFERDAGRLYFASYEGRPIAGAFVNVFGRIAHYKDGGSVRDSRVMAPRLQQWRIMQDLAADGILAYDLGNVPPPSAEGASTTGLMIFKGAYARDVVEYLPTFELPFTPAREAWGAGGETQFLESYKSRTGDSFY
jgi:serine/alanine adding enzyme